MSWLYRRRRKASELEAARARRERTADTTTYADPWPGYDVPAATSYSAPSSCDGGSVTSYSDGGSSGSCDAGGGF
jgi:hypothetical protein